jgi:hypothetical protein
MGSGAKGTRLLLQNETFFGSTKRESGPDGARRGTNRGPQEEQLKVDFFFLIRGLWAFVRRARKFTLSIFPEVLKIIVDACSPALRQGRADGPSLPHPENRGFLECHNAVNTIGAENAELAFVITAEVDEAAATLTSAG